jgi:protein-S-isoprenylcysteine O-methyltransferase Ste14
MTALETRIPPPIIVGAVALVMIGATAIAGGLHLPPAPLAIVAVLAWAAGFGVAASGVREFRRAKTTINPTAPQQASAIVSTGVFRLTRNPMYLGMTTVLVGLALLLSTPWALLGPAAFALYIQRFQIQPEERALAAKFGPAYEQYKASVRRWL